MSGLDQSTAGVSEVLPFVWGRMYSNLMTAGFDSHQALSLVKTYIIVSNSVCGLKICLDSAYSVEDNPDN